MPIELQRRIAWAIAVFGVAAVAIPWSVTGDLDAFQWVQVGAAWVAAALLIPAGTRRLACEVMAVIYLSTVFERVAAQLLDWQDLSGGWGSFFGVSAWIITTAIAMYAAGEVLERTRQ